MRIRIAPSQTMTAPRAARLARALSRAEIEVPDTVGEQLVGERLAARVDARVDAPAPAEPTDPQE